MIIPRLNPEAAGFWVTSSYIQSADDFLPISLTQQHS